jgi:hypothetical protein
MNDLYQKVESLDVSAFDPIASQTTMGDRRSLLAIQRAVARRCGEYTYLEIGSHLGGSIQPHLLDARCKTIYSIDPRPPHQPDDRRLGHVEYYEDNSSQRMLKLLGDVSPDQVGKVHCIDLDASDVDPGQIVAGVRLALIDGEHTRTAVLSDFQACNRVLSHDGTVAFHDFFIVGGAVLEICRMLSQQRRTYVPLKLEDNVVALFFDPETVHSDPYLAAHLESSRYFWLRYRMKSRLKRAIPNRILVTIKRVRSHWTRILSATRVKASRERIRSA